MYAGHLQDWAAAHQIRLPVIPPECEQSYHMFYILLPSLEARTRLIEQLKSKGILSVFHYLPLHLSPMGRQWGYTGGECPVTEDVSDRLLRLPFFNGLAPEEQEEVCDALLGAF
jgi:dTDP-4-amino-4,6-dideoxygalactose transaminase